MKTIRNLMLCLSLLLSTIHFSPTKAALHFHSYTTTTKDATCTSEGYKLKTCKKCGYTEKTTIAKKAHSYGSTTTVNPTCTKEGYKSKTCKNCNYTEKTTLAKKAHSYGSTTTVKATCTTDGYKSKTCKKCNYEHKTTIAKTGHSYGDTTTVSPTCTTDGYTLRTCNNCCNQDVVEKFDRLGHNFEFSFETAISENVIKKTFECSECHRKSSTRYFTNLKGYVDSLFIPEVNIHLSIYESCEENNYLDDQTLVDKTYIGAQMYHNGKLLIGDHNYQNFTLLGLVESGTIITYNGVKYKCVNNEAGTNTKSTLLNNNGEDITELDGDLFIYTCEPTFSNPDGIRLLTWERQ